MTGRKIQAIVLAAGKGTRMGDLETPKVLVGFLGRPLIVHLLEHLKKLKHAVEIIVVTGFNGERVRTELGPSYRYEHQAEQLGTGHAVASAMDSVDGEHVLVFYGDMPLITSKSVDGLIETHLQSQADLTLFTSDPKSFSKHYMSMYFFGRIIRNEHHKIHEIVELREANNAQKEMTEVNPGIYMFRTDWLKENITKLENNNSKNEYYLTDLLKLAVEGGAKVSDMPIAPEEVMGINTLAELRIAEHIMS
ncbi:MAG TPA: NTP transferase domain-containing protein [Patescibacteria group bacterium]|nr:NTP transferase domain-containing protein [Patescibacteria group bacterium]